MCNVIIAFKLKQNSHMWIRVINFPTQQEREKFEVGMDGFTSKKEPWELDLNNRYLVTCNFHRIHLSSSLHMCLIRYPLIPMGTIWLPSLGLISLGLCNWSIVLLSFHSKMVSLVRENSMLLDLIPAFGDSQKSPPQADFLYVKSPRCAWLSPIQINIDSYRCINNFCNHVS